MFHALAPPTAEEVAEVARDTAERVRRLLDENDEDGPAGEPSGWHVCCAASAQGISLFGERAGQAPLRLVDPSQARPDEASPKRTGASATSSSTPWTPLASRSDRFKRAQKAIACKRTPRAETLASLPLPTFPTGLP